MTKILLVEDDKSLREIYGVRLLAEGYDIVSAGDGEEALAMAIKERPQLIVSDVMMPKISGFDMLDILRSTTETKDIKVIMMTALSSEDQRARGEALGADRYLVKSQVGIEDVVRTVHEVLKDIPLKSVTPTQAFTSGAPMGSSIPVNRPAAPAVPSRPATPVAPTPAPVAPTPSAPVAPTPPSSSLPRPTAPFSTTRPANLGDRVIHPLSSPTDNSEDIASLMAKELNEASAPAAPMPAAPTPPTPVTPTPAPAPTAPPSVAPTPQPSALPQPPVPPTPPVAMTPTSTPAVSTLPPSPHGAISFEETPRPTPPQPPAPPSV